ncbi:MAG: cytochrome-c peroxidase [Bacteroidia bacterium]
MKTKLPQYWKSFVFFVPALLIVLMAVASCAKKQSEILPVTKKTFSEPLLPITPYEYPSGNNDLATLGRVLFYDKNLSGDRSVSCGSCHQQQYGFADNKKFSVGAFGFFTERNTHVISRSDNSRFWDGKNQGVFNGITTTCTSSTSTFTNTTILTQGYNVGPPDTLISVTTTTTTTCLDQLIQASVFTNPIKIPFITTGEMNLDVETVKERIAALPYYAELFRKAFPHNTQPVTETNIQAALGTFMDNFVAENSKFDRVNAGSAQFTREESDGLAVFNGKAKCGLCHKSYNNFAGRPGQFEDIGLDAFYTDEGRKKVTNLSSDVGRFHVPPLKNIALTAPYMHDGRFSTLEQVVDFFDNGVQHSANLSSAFSVHPEPDGNGGYVAGGSSYQELLLTPTEKANLVKFLKTLTDYTLIWDVKLSDPFKK